MKTIKRSVALLLAILVAIYMVISLVYVFQLHHYSVEWNDLTTLQQFTVPGVTIWLAAGIILTVIGIWAGGQWIINILIDWYIS